MKEIVCAINSKYIHSSLAPWYLRAAVEGNCCSDVVCSVVEGTINEPILSVVERICSEEPELIGISCYIWNISFVYALIGYLRKALPCAIIVLGGPEVSYCPEEVLRKHPEVDYVLSGEGEVPFALLTDMIALKKKKLQEIPGLCYRTATGEIVVAAPWVDSGDPPDPYSQQYLSVLNGRIAYLETSRGCPFSCAFCLSGRSGPVRYFDLERVKQDILVLANSGTQTVKFVDRTFNANALRAEKIITFILEKYGEEIPSDVCFHFEIAGDLLTKRMIELFSQAPVGLFQLEIGLQSLNSKTLESIGRKTDIQKLYTNVECLVAANRMHIHLDLIAGLPLEGWDSFQEGFDSVYGLGAHMLQLGFLKLLHGAPMREKRDRYPCVFSEDPPYVVEETPWMSRVQLERLAWAEDALDRLHNSGRFRRTLKYILAQQKSAFYWFCEFGEYAHRNGFPGMSLNQYSNMLMEFCLQKNGLDLTVLRDVLVLDRLATDSSGVLPDFLKIQDTALRRAKKMIEADYLTKRKPGVRRSVALLYSRSSVVYVDYLQRHPVTKEYEITEIPFSH